MYNYYRGAYFTITYMYDKGRIAVSGWHSYNKLVDLCTASFEIN